MGAAERRGGSGMTDYADLRRLAEQATPGPWYLYLERAVASRTQDDPIEGNDEAVFSAECYGSRDRADAAYIAAANPQAILALLDLRDGLLVRLGQATERAKAAERRVAALEEGLRTLLDAIPGTPVNLSGGAWVPLTRATVQARALLASASNEAEVPAAPPADDGTPYQSPDLHTGTEHSDRVLTDDK